MENIEEIILATLFVNGEGIDNSAFIEKMGISQKEYSIAVENLKKDYCNKKGIRIITYKNKIQLCSNPDYADQIADILNPIREKALTKAALQTLAIIAYKQPITKLEIEELRQASCDYTVQLLLEHKMIEVVGRKDAVGKPLLLGTTEEFLKRFNLQDINNLPDYDELLDRIRVINQPLSNSLYNEFEVPNEEIIPEFLQGEDLKEISSDDSQSA